MNLYRNNAGAVYPYTLNGVVSMTGASAGGGYYYYFYNCVIAPQPCTSGRTPVTAIIGGPTVTFAPLSTVCSTAPPFALSGGSPLGGTYSGPGVSSGNFDPNAAGIGTHTITYTYTDSNGCQGTATQSIIVSNCLSIGELSGISSWNFFPNPANGDIQLNVNVNAETEASISIINAIGQTVLLNKVSLNPGANSFIWDVSLVPNGVYLLSIQTAEGLTAKRIEILK